jgi:hypothetical protein
VLTSSFWTGWWEMVSFWLRTPQTQEILAVAALVIGALRVVVARRGMPLAILGGLAAGYVGFALAFAAYTKSHPYYALPLIPILALGIGAAVGWTYDRLAGSRVARLALAAIVVAVSAGAAQKAHFFVTAPEPRETIADYVAIGELTRHTTRAIIVDPALAHPIMYWGWPVGEDWDLSHSELPEWIDPTEKDFLIVVGNWQLGHSGLRSFARGRPVVARTDRFTVFDLRADAS